eukprot:TRINITY_DN14542_c0_g3_i1.p1 TRINITY_DN14542_c0_g3~~TRINITY_DN14542_c0_g3_i1.p1  ORF type:complete len:273 (-),score=52.27 TRINITY_DN14542_c0_g3_i1:243-1061(-)
MRVGKLLTLFLFHSKKEMTTLKAIQTTFPSFQHPRKLPNKKNSLVTFCKSNGAESSSSSSPPEGDKSKQELLARIAMLQTQKIRLTDFLDERSAYLTQFAEDANVEFDEIAENALKGLDEASARIMGNLEDRMQALEETVESNKLEIEENERKLEEFEDQIEKDRNEGLFFKNLKQAPPQERVEAKEEIQKIRDTNRESAGSKIRRNIYLALICLLALTIVNSVISSPEVEWQKVAALGLILIGLLAQFIYEQRMSSETESTEEKEEQKQEK